MRLLAILTIMAVVCTASSGWSGKGPCQEPTAGLFDIVFEIVTAPCLLLATCLGLGTSPDCVPPKKVEIKKIPSTPQTQSKQGKTLPVVSKSSVPEAPAQSDRSKPSQSEPAGNTKTVPMKEFTATENQGSPQVTSPRTPDKPGVTVLAPETPQTNRPVGKPMSETKDSTQLPLKEHEKAKSAVGTITETAPKPKAPELSPPKVEQSSSQEPEKQFTAVTKEKSPSKRPSSSNYKGYPCGPYYQPYPSCGPRFFFR